MYKGSGKFQQAYITGSRVTAITMCPWKESRTITAAVCSIGGQAVDVD